MKDTPHLQRFADNAAQGDMTPADAWEALIGEIWRVGERYAKANGKEEKFDACENVSFHCVHSELIWFSGIERDDNGDEHEYGITMPLDCLFNNQVRADLEAKAANREERRRLWEELNEEFGSKQ